MEERELQATPHETLLNELLDSRVPKTEREHAAAREIEFLRGCLDGADAMHEAEKIVHAKTRAERDALQRALVFWLPIVPADGGGAAGDRIAEDAMLLYCYDGPPERSAEERGWIALSPTASLSRPQQAEET